MKNFVFLEENFNPMETKEAKKRIRSFLNIADEKSIKLLYAIVEIEENDTPTIPASHYEEIHRRRARHLAGETPSYTWEEAKAMIINSKKNK